MRRVVPSSVQCFYIIFSVSEHMVEIRRIADIHMHTIVTSVLLLKDIITP